MAAAEQKVVIDMSGMGGGSMGGMNIPGGIGGAMGGLGKLTTIAGGILVAVGILVGSSKMLQSVLGGIGKTISLIIKPLGDIIAIGLMPIIYILKPIGMFFNMMMRPYLLKAMAAMRAGNMLLGAGDMPGAIGAFMLGFQYLLKPVLNLFINIFDPILKLFGTDAPSMIKETDDALDRMLGGLYAKTAALGDESFPNLISSLTRMGLSTDQIEIGFLNTAADMDTLTAKMLDENNWASLTGDWMDKLSDKAKAMINELESGIALVAQMSQGVKGPSGGYLIKPRTPTVTPNVSSLNDNSSEYGTVVIGPGPGLLKNYPYSGTVSDLLNSLGG